MAGKEKGQSCLNAGLVGLPPADAALLRLVLADCLHLPSLLDWISLKDASQAVATSDDKGSLPSQDSDRFGSWKNHLLATTQQSFAVSFLNYIRTQVHSLNANAQVRGKAGATGTMPPSDPGTTEVKGKQSEIIHVHQRKKQTEPPDRSTQQEYQSVLHAGHDAVQKTCLELERREPGAGGADDFLKPRAKVSYENDFPALATSSVAHTQNGPSTFRRQTRRVTPTIMESPIVDSAFILADVQQLNPVQVTATTRPLRSGPMKLDMDLLMQRCGKAGKLRSKGKLDLSSRMDKSRSSPSDRTEVVDRLIADLNAAMCLTAKPSVHEFDLKLAENSCNKDVASHENTATVEVLPLQTSPASITQPMHVVGNAEEQSTETRKKLISGRLRRLALIHSKLLVSKMVPSLLGELHLLFQLLSWDAEMVAKDPMVKCCSETGNEAHEKLFSSSDDGPSYACAVLEHAGTILDSVGEHLLSALLEVPAISHCSSSLLSRLKGSLADYQASALRSCKGYDATIKADRALQVSPGKYLNPPSAWVGMPVMMPFQASRDSRKNFKTREEQRVFNNREICRDRFYTIMRSALSTQNPFTSAATSEESFRKYMESVRQFLTVLLFENYSWFAELFMEQVLQISSWGETDPEVTGLARQDPGKLQRLHDRMTGSSSCQLSTCPQKQGPYSWSTDFQLPLSPSSPWSQVRNFQSTNHSESAGNLKASNRTRESASLPMRHNTDSVGSWSHFSRLFPQSLRPYVWFLEAADSYRLNIHLVWSIVAKLSSLAEFPSRSQAAVDILTGFTDRVLILKALAGLLGFLTFSPGAAMLRPMANLPAHEGIDKGSHMSRTAPPINVVDILRRAVIHGSMLLNLPWVLEFLCFAKTDQESQSQTYFQDALLTLRRVYMLPMLDPSSPDFSVGSICILSSLDTFFDNMDLPYPDISEPSPGSSDSSKDVHVTDKRGMDVINARDSEKRDVFNAVDRISGIIDSRYIQHCCPLIMDLRLILLEGNKRRQRQLSLSGSPEATLRRFPRKITPVERLSHPQPSLIGGLLEQPTAMEDTIISKQDHLKSSLQRKFLEQRPQVRRLVDFVVDVIASNAASAATSKCLPPVLESAYCKLEIALSAESSNVDDLRPGTRKLDGTRAPHYEAVAEHVITGSLHEVLSAAMEYAKGHAVARTLEALAALLNPDENSYIWGVAAGIATEEADSAACRKVLASISSNIRKHIFKKVENWQKEHSTASHGKAQSYSSTNQKFCNQSKALNTTNIAVKRHLSFAAGDTLPSPGGASIMEQHDLTVERRQKLLANTIIYNCAATCRYCSSETIHSGDRYLLRHHLATVCMSMESLLFQIDGGVPPGGLDSTVIEQKMDSQNQNSDSNHVKEKIFLLFQAQRNEMISEGEMRIELGLIRRAISFSVRLCLLSPFITFGLRANMQALVSKCSCKFIRNTDKQSYPRSSNVDLTVHSIEDNPRLPYNLLTGCAVLSDSDVIHSKTSTRATRASKHDGGSSCKINDWVGGVMQALLSMWRAIIKCNICSMDFMMVEFLAPWRWWLALIVQTLDTTEAWLIVVKHGIAGIIMQMLGEVSCLKDMEAAVETLLHSMCSDSSLSKEEESDCRVHQFAVATASEIQKTRRKATTLAKAISNQLLEWQSYENLLTISDSS
ncbi:hypothetical protein O6H91_02G047900 [Diphasiastrum complanatum]|uniref:Uncharacterized protein n=1 Tax=Diphasiastrum complanatum TaxID=34168 RepID=A0ACC2EF08_DIPCM|nr:hypothetical protein O6H91_02G047900 [Diphasiastrum complanatum]